MSYISPEIKKIFKSTRFQAVVIIAIVGILQGYSVVTPEIAGALYVIFGSHIGIRTIDRFGENMARK